MKKILIVVIMLLSIVAHAQSSFYYYKQEKIPLALNTEYAYLITSISSKDNLEKKLQGKATVVRFAKDAYHQRLIKTYSNSSAKMVNSANHYAEIKFNNPLSESEMKKELEILKSDPSIIATSNCYNNSDNDRVAVTNYIWVGLKAEADIEKLKTVAATINFSVVGQNPFMPEWVMLCPMENASISQVEAAQKLHETGLFLAAEPELLGKGKHDCVNDALFANQWGLSNTGQYSGTVGMDTRVCGAWDHTVGSNAVDIAIMDEGVDLTHPDLINNKQSDGYNTVSGTTPSVIFGSHGTACAGIAAAQGNNSIGVSGVARGADWFSVAIDFDNMTWAQVSDGFNWARNNGAEILSNSWGWNNPSSLFDAAVTNALTLGRGGLGCVVLFSAGNDNLTALIYPKNSNAGLIIVGSISPCGERKSPTSCDGETWWGSNRGTGLDVMAPGVLISTTDRQGTSGYNTSAGTAGNYTDDFNGTSSACPHAAGVAGLILSANSCLTRTEVEQIMKRTSRKIGGYSYSTSLADGTWNTEMGHGLLDAEAAVIMAKTKYLQNLTNTGTVTHQSPIIKAGFNVNPFITNGDYTTGTSANVTIIAGEEADFRTGCDLRGTVDVQIASPGACSNW